MIWIPVNIFGFNKLKYIRVYDLSQNINYVGVERNGGLYMIKIEKINYRNKNARTVLIFVVVIENRAIEKSGQITKKLLSRRK